MLEILKRLEILELGPLLDLSFFFWRILLNGGGKTAICVEGFLNLLWPGCRDRSLPAAKDVTGSGRMDRWDSPENLIDCCRRCCVSLMGVTRWIDLSSRVIFGVQSIVSRSWILPSPPSPSGFQGFLPLVRSWHPFSFHSLLCGP